MLMFNTGPEHGEAASTFTFKANNSIMRASHRPNTALCLTKTASKL